MDKGENKKVNLEDLSKEDLIKKCKGLITLAQKAKVSKENLLDENKKLKEQSNQKVEIDGGAAYEILEKLTEEKLLLVTEIEGLKSRNNTLEDKLKYNEEESRLIQGKLSKLETENISYNRQVKRLTDENEQLLTDLSALELQITELNNLDVQQQEQLLQLEKNNGNSFKDLQNKLSDSLEEIKKLNNSLRNKEKEVKELSQELQASKIIKNSSIYDSNKDCVIYIKEINDLRTRNENSSKVVLEIQNINEKLKDKVTLYHSKLKKFALTIKEMKEEKYQVIQIFKAYTEQIKDWKEQLLSASRQLVKLVNDLEKENKILKENEATEVALVNLNSNADLIEKLALYEHEIELLKKQVEEKEKFNNSLKLIRDQYESEKKSMHTEVLNCNSELNRLKKELVISKEHLEKSLFTKQTVELESKKLLESLHNYKKEIDNVNQELKSKETLLNETLVEKEKCSLKNKNLNETLITYEEKVINLNKEFTLKETLLKQENTNLNDALIKSVDTEKRLAEKSSQEILRLAESNKELEKRISELQVQLHKGSTGSYVNNTSQTEEDLVSNDSIREDSMPLKRENSELLLEMNQMNQALKERGEIISKLEAHCEEIKKRLQLYETQANKNVDSITEKDEIIKALSQEVESLRYDNKYISSAESEIVASLKAEIETLKEKLNNSIDNSYAESDTMSTSTISKSEEVNQLKELEGSWEERYGKLRTLAVKLKAKIREQLIIITEQQTEKEELQKQLSNSLIIIQGLQSQIDSLQDDVDKVKAENKKYLSKLNSIAENISKDKQLLVENEETILKLRKETEKRIAEKQGVDNWKKQVSAKVQTLRKELEAKNLLVKESEAKISKLEADLESKDIQLKNEQESHKQTKGLLDQTSNESKKNSVLNLEMQDYERSVKELSQKVEKQKGEINNLQAQFDMQKCTLNALREQNKLLEERIQEEQKNGNTTSLEIGAFKKNIANLEEVLQQKEDKILDMIRLMETIRSENEELSTELSKVIAEHQKSLNMVKSERDQLRNQILILQQSLRETQNMLKLKEDELMAIKEDYETYKVRAQSVLKKNQNRDLGLEEKLLEELATIKSQNNELTTELKELRDKSENCQFFIEEITKEKNGLKGKCIELEDEVEELKSYSEQLANKYQRAITEHAESVRNLKVHAETLSQCYRQQLSEQEVRHNREIIELQSRLDKAPSPIETSPVHPNMPREEGEGSESIESNSPPNNVHPIPLERLLDSTSDDEVMHLKKQFFEQESKVVHLTALLSDTEQDLAKHVQMNKLLKEEIRRQQRSVEREKHAENLEYLKNVVFKFVTLNSGDERTRLVPVLNTILKLSPEETQKLLIVARGDQGIKGWASYLPTWSSPNKQQ